MPDLHTVKATLQSGTLAIVTLVSEQFNNCIRGTKIALNWFFLTPHMLTQCEGTLGRWCLAKWWGSTSVLHNTTGYPPIYY